MASVVVRSQEAWYVRVDRPGKPDSKIPCVLFGTPTNDRVALMKSIVDAVVAEAMARKPRGRPPKAAVAEPADTAAVVAAALAKMLGGGPAAAPGVVAAAAAVGEIPTPSECAEWYFAHYMKPGKNAPQTIKSSKSVVGRAIREMGGDSWDAWISTDKDNGSWAWVGALMTTDDPPKEMKKATRGRYVSLLHAWRAACAATNAKTTDGRSYSAIPDFMPGRYRPAALTPHQLLEAGIARESDHVTPFTVEEVRAILRTVDAAGYPLYFRMAVHALAKTGMNPADVYAMFTKGGTFEWDRKDGIVWYHSARTKTATPIDVPLCPSLADLLRPYRHGDDSLWLREDVAGIDTWPWHFDRVYGLANVKRLPGKSLGRFRHTMNGVMENTLGVPESIRESLMAHRLKKAGRINTNYTAPERTLMVKAIRDFDALLTAPLAARETA